MSIIKPFSNLILVSIINLFFKSYFNEYDKYFFKSYLILKGEKKKKKKLKTKYSIILLTNKLHHWIAGSPLHILLN